MTQVVKREPPLRRQWVWFRNEPGGRPLPREELDSLDVAGRAGLVMAMQRYRDGQTHRHGVRSLGDGLLELGYRHGREQFRLIFMQGDQERKLVALTAFQKTTGETPVLELGRARERASKLVRAALDEALENLPAPARTEVEQLSERTREDLRLQLLHSLEQRTREDLRLQLLQRMEQDDREMWASVLAMQSSENTSSKLVFATWALVVATVGLVVATIVLVLVTVAKP